MRDMTQAVAYDRYGRIDVLTTRMLPLRRLGPADVLVRVRAAALNPKDGLFRRGNYRALSGARFPKQVGCDFAGEVVRVGGSVSTLAPGDEVWGTLNELTFARGSLAQLLVARASECGKKPAKLGFDEAASIPLCALTALQALRDVADTKEGDRVLVHGASGGVGVHAIQIARALGAEVETTSSPKNFELCRELGADEALDYQGNPAFGRRGRYDVIFDAVGNQSFARAEAALAEDGVYVSTVPSPRLALDIARTAFARKKARIVLIRSKTADLDLVARWADEGRLRPVVDRVYDVREVRTAFRHLESRRARGKIVLRIPQGDGSAWTLDD